jgi:pyruvate kinase
MSGYTAQQIARHRPSRRVMAVSPSLYTQRRLALTWGVECVLVPDFEDTDSMIEETIAVLRPFNLPSGGKMVITAGIPFKTPGHTNFIQVHTIT